jgi:hypothetical protein
MPFAPLEFVVVIAKTGIPTGRPALGPGPAEPVHPELVEGPG